MKRAGGGAGDMAGEHCRRDSRAWYVPPDCRAGPNEPDVRWLRFVGRRWRSEGAGRPAGLEGHLNAQVPILGEPFRKPLPVPTTPAGSGGRCFSCELLFGQSLNVKASEHRPRARYRGR